MALQNLDGRCYGETTLDDMRERLDSLAITPDLVAHGPGHDPITVLPGSMDDFTNIMDFARFVTDILDSQGQTDHPFYDRARTLRIKWLAFLGYDENDNPDNAPYVVDIKELLNQWKP